jgi:hypothetical protein
MPGLSGVRPPLFASWLVYKLASASQIINLFLPFLTLPLLGLLDYTGFPFISLISFVTRSYIWVIRSLHTPYFPTKTDQL